MRNFLILCAAVGLLVTAMPAKAAVTTNTLIKGSLSTVYYYATNGKRYVFPTENTYKSWYGNSFFNVVTISDTELASYPLGGNVTYRPGVKLVKVTTDPKTYAIDKGGVLRWIKTEQVASALYGADWAKKVDDLPDAFFTNYSYGTPIDVASTFDPMAITNASYAIWVDKSLPTPQEKSCGQANGRSMTQSAARTIALASCKHADITGMKADEPWCNDNSGTWWFPLSTTKTICNPACVVTSQTGLAEINWMCTGAL